MSTTTHPTYTERGQRPGSEMETYRVTSPEAETVTVTIPTEVTRTADAWRVEHNGRYVGAINASVGPNPWRAFWFNDSRGNGGSDQATRDEAVAAVVAGSDR